MADPARGEQPTLTDGVVTLRPWRDEDVDAAVAGHDQTIADWFGRTEVAATREEYLEALQRWRAGWPCQGSSVASTLPMLPTPEPA